MNIGLSNKGLRTIGSARRKKFGLGGILFTAVFGLLFMSVGVFALNMSSADSSWIQVDGEISSISSRRSDGSTMYTPNVSYSVDGQTYSVSSNFSSSSRPSVGDSRTVAYNPNNPEESKIIESLGATWWVWIFPIVGVAVVAYGINSFTKDRKRTKEIERLKQTGHKLSAVVTEVKPFGKNGSTHRIVVTAVNAGGASQLYTSDLTSGATGLAMSDFQNNPVVLDVYVDQTDPQNYYVDVDGVPGLTPQRITELVKSAATQSASPTVTTTTEQPIQNYPPQPPATQNNLTTASPPQPQNPTYSHPTPTPPQPPTPPSPYTNHPPTHGPGSN